MALVHVRAQSGLKTSHTSKLLVRLKFILHGWYYKYFNNQIKKRIDELTNKLKRDNECTRKKTT